MKRKIKFEYGFKSLNEIEIMNLMLQVIIYPLKMVWSIFDNDAHKIYKGQFKK